MEYYWHEVDDWSWDYKDREYGAIRASLFLEEDRSVAAEIWFQEQSAFDSLEEAKMWVEDRVPLLDRLLEESD